MAFCVGQTVWINSPADLPYHGKEAVIQKIEIGTIRPYTLEFFERFLWPIECEEKLLSVAPLFEMEPGNRTFMVGDIVTIYEGLFRGERGYIQDIDNDSVGVRINDICVRRILPTAIR